MTTCARARADAACRRKLGQTLDAQRLERHWRKDQILEAYLNPVPFRGEVVGIDALSRTLFGKEPSGLDAREAALAAALVRAPNATPAQVAQRACEPAANDEQAGPDLRKADARTPMRHVRQRRPCNGACSIRATASRRHLAGAASRRVRPARRPGAHPHDPARAAATLRARRLAAPPARTARPRGRGRRRWSCSTTPAAKCWPGSAPAAAVASAAEVDGVLAQRQAGSTLKPFLYAQAIDERRLTAASLLDDSPAQISTASGLYIPQNYDQQFKGHVSVRTALGSSLNVPAVRTLVMVSPEAFARQLRAAGMPLRESGDYYGYSLALGECGGVPAGVDERVPDARQRWPLQPDAGRARRRGRPRARPGRRSTRAQPSSWRDILGDANARARTFGLDSVLGTRFWTRRQDRHQQGHARQLGHRLVAALHGRRMGRQCQRRADAGRERHQGAAPVWRP